MIKFIYGPSPSKKSSYITNMIAKDSALSKHSFLIVPEQFAVHTERQMLTSLPSTAELELEVLNFSRLYNRVCREYGGLHYNYITKPLRYAMMWQCLHENADFLEVYGKYTNDISSLCEMMLSSLGEFKASCISPSELERAAKKLKNNDNLSKKLRDLAHIFSVFETSVNFSFSDSSDDLLKLDDILSEHSFFKDSNVYIDSFTSLTAAEYRIVDKIFKQADNVFITIALSHPNENTIYTASILEAEHTLFKLAKNNGGYETVIIEDDVKKNSEIKLFSSELWLSEKNEKAEQTEKDGTGVHLYKCSTPYTEAEAVAAVTLSLLREGYRCRDIVVLARDAESYRGIIEAPFEHCDIPYYFSEKLDLLKTPLVKFILSALRICMYNWSSADVISHLSCSLYDIDKNDIDMFEQYVSTWQIRGALRFSSDDFEMDPDGYSDKEITKRGRRTLDAANRVRKMLCDSLIPFFDELESSKAFEDKCRAIYRFIKRAGTDKRLYEFGKKKENDTKLREADEYYRLFSNVCDSLASLAEAMAPDSLCYDLSTKELYELLTLYFSKTEIGSIPTSADQIIIGSASMMRSGSPKCVLMLGMCEGVFPAPVNDTGLLSFYEKQQLSDVDVVLSQNAATASSDELMFVQRSVDSASERLYMFTHSSSADGRKSTPSLPFERAVKLFDRKPIPYDSKSVEKLTPSLRTALSNLSLIEDSSQKDIILECAAKDEKLVKLIAKRYLDISDTRCSVSPLTAESIFGDKIKLSQSKIDKFVNCHFNYYCSYVLKLREEQTSRFKANDIGTFIHYILEKLLANIVSEDGVDAELPIEKIEQMTRDTVHGYIKKISPKGLPVSARLSHLYRRLYNLSLLLVCNIIEEFRHSSFRPEFFELTTSGEDDSPSPREFMLKDGTRIVFAGIIDRVDIFRRDDGKVYIRVVDYKTGTKQFSLEDIEHGLNIQMLLYLYTLLENKNEKFNKKIGASELDAAGVVYLSSNAPTLDLNGYEDAATVMGKAAKELKRSGLFLNDEQILLAMNDKISPEFLGGIRKKADGSLSGKALASAEIFNALKTKIDDTVCNIAEEMKSGNADASPLMYGTKDPCEYCAMKPVCRRKIK